MKYFISIFYDDAIYLFPGQIFRRADAGRVYLSWRFQFSRPCFCRNDTAIIHSFTLELDALAYHYSFGEMASIF